MKEINVDEKIKAIRENPNNTDLVVKEELDKMQYNNEMTKITGEMFKYTKWLSWVIIFLTLSLISGTAKSYFDGDQSFTLLAMTLTAIVASIGLSLKMLDLYLKMQGYIQKNILIEKNLIN